MGVAGVCGGVKHTSGNEQMDLPLIDLAEICIPLANTLLATLNSLSLGRTP
jgi:hypothetical protein